MYCTATKRGKRFAKHPAESMTPSRAAEQTFTPESRFETPPSFGGGRDGFDRRYSGNYHKTAVKSD